ncbi:MULTISPECIES: siderophore-interacting protein [unclassified Luteococcus]|uniref:siderophore-interacting protein n=1 Tax=unclassified Luteococcus TaxID=2639923 RepID=UPI00313EA706
MEHHHPQGHAPDDEGPRIARWWFPLKPRRIEVVWVRRLSEHMVRLRFTGPDLDDFPTVAPEDHVKLFFDPDDHNRIVLPELDEQGRASFGGLTYRDYTVRAFDPAGPWLDVDVVLHGGGIASNWAARARPGDALGMLGPRGSFQVKDVFDQYLFACDETALPAMARWLEMLRPGVPVTAYVEVAGPSDELPLQTRADLHLVWLHRDGRPAGSTRLLEQAVRGHALPSRGDFFVWVAGESTSIKPLRRYLARDLGLPRDNWDVDGYWRRGQTNHDHHIDEEDESADAA